MNERKEVFMLDCKAEATALLTEFFSEELSKQRLSLRDFQ